MTRIFIVEPETGKLLTAEEWKNKAEDVTKAEFVVIVPGDGSQAFAIAKKTVGSFPWKKAKEKVAALSDTLNNEPFAEWGLPTRKQWIDIREARACGLDQVLELIGGDELLKDLRRGEWDECRELRERKRERRQRLVLVRQRRFRVQQQHVQQHPGASPPALHVPR